MAKIAAHTVVLVRQVTLGLTGLVCAAYAVLAVLLGRPDPISAWIPGGLGIVSAIVITISFALTDEKGARIAKDELYRAESDRAQRIAYWVALFLYPVFGVFLSQGWVSFPVAFAAMGTLSGAAFLLIFVFLNARG